MTEEFVDAIDWQELKKENDEALQQIEIGRRLLDQERCELENEKRRVWWEQEQERRRLRWEWSQLDDAKSRFQAEKSQFEDQKRRHELEIDEEKSRQDWEWKKFDDERRQYEKRKEESASASWMFREIKGLKRRFAEKERDEAHRRRKDKKVTKEKEHREQIEADIRHKVRIEETERMRVREEIEKDKTSNELHTESNS